MLEDLNHSVLSEQLHSKFKLHFDSADPVEVELIEVGKLTDTTRQEMFSIIFSVPDGIRPTQGSYRMEHDTLGTFILFLVPVQNDDSIVFEAVFNRLKKKKPASS